MGSKIKNFLFVFIFISLILNVSAADILKPAKLNESYTILQTCASCSTVNITISSVDGIIVANQEMTNNGSGVWNYSFIPTVTSRHDVTGVGDLGGTDTSFVTFFDVTPSGKIATTGDSVLYFLFSIIFFGVIILLTFFVFVMPNKNEKNARGEEMVILKIKYVRFFLMFLLYPLMILLLNFLLGLSNNFTALSMFSGIFGFLFQTLLSLAWVFTLVMIIRLILMAVHDTNVYKQIKKLHNLDIFRK